MRLGKRGTVSGAHVLGAQGTHPRRGQEQGYTQAAGHPAWGITDFKVATVGNLPNEAPLGIVTHVRTDVGPGVSTNPEAVAQRSFAEFGAAEAIPGTGFYAAPECKKNKKGEVESEIGVNKVTVYTGTKPFPEGGTCRSKARSTTWCSPPVWPRTLGWR